MLSNTDAAQFIFKTFKHFDKNPFLLEGHKFNYSNHTGIIKMVGEFIPVGNSSKDPVMGYAEWEYCTHCGTMHTVSGGTRNVFRYWCEKCVISPFDTVDSNLNPRVRLLRSNPGYTMYLATTTTIASMIEPLLYAYFMESIDK